MTRFGIPGLGLAVIVLAVSINFATAVESPLPIIDRVELGIQGQWKIGYDFPVRATIVAGRSQLKAIIEIETVDSDGVGVIYQEACEIEANQSKSIDLIVCHGRTMRPILIRIVDLDGNRIVERLVTEQERGTMLPIDQPWVIGIGAQLNLDQAALRSANGSLSSYTSTEVSQASGLPKDAAGYQGVDLLVVSTRDHELLASLTSDQRNAIVHWIHQGGHALIWLGENAEQVSKLDWIASLLSVDVLGTAKGVDPAILESFLSSQRRLGKLTCAKLNPRSSLVDLSLISNDRQKLPVLLRCPTGFGRIDLCAFDLDQAPLRDWSERRVLLERLLLDHWLGRQEARWQGSHQSNYLGYDDMAGQTHAVLDVFAGVRLGSLTLLAFIFGGFILLLGPFDYLVVSKAWRRPAWTWLTLSLWACLAMVGFTALVKNWKPSHQAINSIEFLDYDYTSSMIRGRALAHCYSGQAGRFDFSARAREVFIDSEKSVSNSSAADNVSKIRTRLSWSGQPGRGLRGFDSQVRTDLGFSAYRVRTESVLEESVFPDNQGVDLIDVGIPFAGSKAMRATWTESLEIPLNEFGFTTVGPTEALRGVWVNPMDEDLLDGWLLFRGWLYPLPSRIRPKGKIQISEDDIPKDAGRRLQRRQVVKENDMSTPWDPTDRCDYGRLVELLAFHRTGGGSGYTGLDHQYWKELDFSNHLQLRRAIVFGRLASPLVVWSARNSGRELEVRDGQRLAVVRFVIPVALSSDPKSP